VTILHAKTKKHIALSEQYQTNIVMTLIKAGSEALSNGQQQNITSLGGKRMWVKIKAA